MMANICNFGLKKRWRLTFNHQRSTPVDSAQLMDCFFFFPQRIFCYSRARIDTEYFFHESTLLYSFNTLYIACAKRRNLQTRSMSCNQNSRFGSLVYGYEGSVSLLDELLCTRLSHITFGFQNSNPKAFSNAFFGKKEKFDTISKGQNITL